MKHLRIIACCLILGILIATPLLGSDRNETNVVAANNPFDGKPIKGTVLETMNSGGYTYLKVKSEKGTVWVAVPESPVKKGQEVVCNPGMAMSNFESKTLNRTFDTIIFSSGLGGKQANPHKSMMNPHGSAMSEKKGGMSFSEALQRERGMAGSGRAAMGSAAMSTGSTGAIVPSAEVTVKKAAGDNAHTVGECFSQADKLDGKTVRVRGKVMKVSRMIMGRNWVHLQDGTGNPMENTHDLVVTTMEEPKKDSIVTLEGTLHANRDFGAGYRYDAIIEDAKVIKE